MLSVWRVGGSCRRERCAEVVPVLFGAGLFPGNKLVHVEQRVIVPVARSATGHRYDSSQWSAYVRDSSRSICL